MWRRWWKTTMATRWIRCSSTTQMGTWLRYATVRTSQSYPSLPAPSSPERVCTTLVLLDIISVDLRRIWWWISVDSWRLWWWSLSIRTWWTFHSKACLCWRDEKMRSRVNCSASAANVFIIAIVVVIEGCFSWPCVWFDTESIGFMVFVIKDWWNWLRCTYLLYFSFFFYFFFFDNGNKIWWWITEMYNFSSCLKREETCIKWITIFYTIMSFTYIFLFPYKNYNHD